MPFTFFHLALPLACFAIYRLLIIFISVPLDLKFWIALTAGSVLPDIQGFIGIFSSGRIPLHGFSHTIVGVLVYTILFHIILVIYAKTEFPISQYLGGYKLKYSVVYGVSSLFFHLLADVFIYPDMKVFWPFSGIDYGEVSTYPEVARLLTTIGLYSIIILLVSVILDVIKQDRRVRKL